MNEIQQRIVELQAKGWTIAAIAAELDVHHSTVRRWESGDRYPENAKPVLMAFDALLQRKRIPKQRRYAPGSRRRTQAGAGSE